MLSTRYADLIALSLASFNIALLVARLIQPNLIWWQWLLVVLLLAKTIIIGGLLVYYAESNKSRFHQVKTAFVVIAAITGLNLAWL
ncbi:hypothetical protein VB834_19525 [Limnoraphis robusta Tam1]|uniref:hypothetical protein n=1 Tax=Limnoraphis robusta TaxID=1118279 RepID=UPI002B21D38A|nr:hypothetical protein [Limnoraphis robusta]MEA5501460.1 hypothetical protein [Limnoraphis robusta BA-68 BA1]MEA5541220.1 hypothetical protein [Limnoraphis robusta Tam1]